MYILENLPIDFLEVFKQNIAGTQEKQVKAPMRFQRTLFTILAVMAVCTARAQSQVDLTVRHQHTNGDTLFFDVYLQLVSGTAINLENSDFIFDYDLGNFVNPQF